jgi:hypothetical protein
MLGYSEDDDSFATVVKTIGWLLVAAACFGVYLLYCGFTTMYGRDGEVIGQAKRLTMVTPFWSSFCQPYYELDLSLGVLQNGVGSISKQDMIFTVLNTEDLPKMKAAVEAGSIIKVKYDTRRLAACTATYLATGLETGDIR